MQNQQKQINPVFRDQIVTTEDLAQWLGKDEKTIRTNLKKMNVPVIRICNEGYIVYMSDLEVLKNDHWSKKLQKKNYENSTKTE